MDVDTASTIFADLDITDEGRWKVDPNILNVFIDAAAQDIKYCPVIITKPYDGVKACNFRPADDAQCCLFCNAAMPLRIMLDHVADHSVPLMASEFSWHNGRSAT